MAINFLSLDYYSSQKGSTPMDKNGSKYFLLADFCITEEYFLHICQSMNLEIHFVYSHFLFKTFVIQ